MTEVNIEVSSVHYENFGPARKGMHNLGLLHVYRQVTVKKIIDRVA